MATDAGGRGRLRDEGLVRTAIALADAEGLDAVSMRRVAAELGVVPMALYKHVGGKEELVNAMVDATLREIDVLESPSDWRPAVRARVLAARRVQLAHPWLRRALETRTTRTPAVLGHTDAVIGAFRGAGFSDPLTHHVMHALGSRLWGFTQDLFEDADAPVPDAAQLAALGQAFPNIAAAAGVAVHDDGTVVDRGCDDQFEFEFALDLLLDGFGRLHDQGWLPPVR